MSPMLRRSVAVTSLLGLSVLMAACIDDPVQPLNRPDVEIPSYTIVMNSTTFLPIQRGSLADANAINDLGMIVGTEQLQDGSYQAIMWTTGRKVLQTPGKAPGNAWAYGINHRKQIVGNWQSAAGPGGPVYWDRTGVAHELATLSSSSPSGTALGVNGSGTAVGESLETADYSTHAVVWDLVSNSITDIHPSGAGINNSHAAAINDAGDVAGGSWFGVGLGRYHRAIRWVGGVAEDLGVLGTRPGANYSSASAINNNGWVVGQSSVAASPYYRAFLWVPGSGMTALPLLPGTQSSDAHGINDVGDITGTIDSKPVVWEHGTLTPSVLGDGTIYGSGNAIAPNGTPVGTAYSAAQPNRQAATWDNATGNNPPVAVIVAPAPAVEGAQELLDGRTSSDPDGNALSFVWDFGDGSAYEYTSKAKHAFEIDGTFTVTLTVVDSHGASNVATTSITVANRAPTPLITLPTSPPAAQTDARVSVGFTDRGAADTADGSITWGDGSSPQNLGSFTQGYNSSVYHRYAAQGTYKIKLTMTDHGGATKMVAAMITIGPVGSGGGGGDE